MRMRGGRDQKVHRSCSGSAANLDNCRGQLSVAGGHGAVDRYSIERPLKQQQAAQSFSADILVFRDEDAEM